jgi:hypothetical protein
VVSAAEDHPLDDVDLTCRIRTASPDAISPVPDVTQRSLALTSPQRSGIAALEQVPGGDEGDRDVQS